MDRQALTFSLHFSHTSYTHVLPLRRFQGVCTAPQFELICMQAFGRPDERVVHILLNGQPDWECINIRARGEEDGLIQAEREDRGRDCEINTASARTTVSVRARDGKKIDCLKPKAKKLQCRAVAALHLWFHTVLPIGWRIAWYTVLYHPVMNSLSSCEWIAMCMHAEDKKPAPGNLTLLLFQGCLLHASITASVSASSGIQGRGG